MAGGKSAREPADQLGADWLGAACDTSMNYRHSFHAGNFADVLKHAVLALVVEHLSLKPTPFRVIDTHAGRGLYDLAGDAARTGEWQDGIGRLWDEPLPADVQELLGPYLGAVRSFNPNWELRFYPGSPVLARNLIRPGDQLVANELHPDDYAALARHFARDAQTRVLALDGWTAIRSLLPPKERRGLVLIDPPFEKPGEFEQIATGLEAAMQRFANGIYLVWFPIKDRRAVNQFYDKMRAVSPRDVLAAELDLGQVADFTGLTACGIAVINPPFRLFDQLAVLGNFLAGRLQKSRDAAFQLAWISPAL